MFLIDNEIFVKHQQMIDTGSVMQGSGQQKEKKRTFFLPADVYV